eukprot:jgi/Psemu1/251898/estExt_Genewise1Plus.C_350158
MVLLAITTTISFFPIPVHVVDAKKAAPELTSTALKVHKAYTSFPPHDTDLYDIMGVSPNATLAQITKSYRSLSRRYHPDKQRHKNNNNINNNNEHAERKLEQLQKSYEILSDDSKRLPYHRYGLVDPNLAAFLLLGPRVCPASYSQRLQQQQQQQHSRSHHGYSNSPRDKTSLLFDRLDRELLHLMGYDDSAMDALAMAVEAANCGETDDPSKLIYEHRVRTVAALLLESIRPVVEGRLDARLYAQMLTQDCDRWKRLPLGAQIIRSVGRAYRHEGSEFLQRHRNRNRNADDWNNSGSRGDGSSGNGIGKQMVLQLQTDLKIGFRRRWRSTKDFLEAATVSGRLAMAERSFNEHEKKLKLQQQEKQQRKRESYERIEYHGSTSSSSSPDTTSGFLPQMDDYLGDNDTIDDTVDFDFDDYESLEELEEEQKELEQLQAKQTLLQTMQIEALWKVCKIDLDRVVRKACASILSGEYFFYPLHQSSHYGAPVEVEGGTSGWVASSGQTIDSEQAKIAAAEVMKMTGEIMVQQSKEGTSWKQ